MSLTLWPTGADLKRYASAMGSEIPASLDAQAMADQAKAEFEEKTGYEPFLATGDDADHVYDPPGGNLLFLRGGFVSVESVTLSGTALTDGTDYWLLPTGRTPITRIKFAGFVWGAPGTVVVNGDAGYSETIPYDVFDAICARGAVIALQPFGVGGLVKQGSVTIDDSGGGEDPVQAMRGVWDRAIAKYQQVRL